VADLFLCIDAGLNLDDTDAELQDYDYKETVFLHVILRSHASGGTTKNLLLHACAEILRGVYPELAEGLRMTVISLHIHNYHHQFQRWLTWKQNS
jgi:hypothetical protein